MDVPLSQSNLFSLLCVFEIIFVFWGYIKTHILKIIPVPVHPLNAWTLTGKIFHEDIIGKVALHKSLKNVFLNLTSVSQSDQTSI